MKQLTEQQITSNWSDLRTIINNTFSGERLEKLNKMYDYFEDRMVVAPASGRAHFHNAMVGGYVEHILHIVKFSQEIRDIWEKNGATINFTNEELVFAALHHDLGKVGDLENDYYIPQESDWHRKNRGEIFTHNSELQYMTVTDRACWILQHFEIPMTQWEFIGLRLTDGLYEEGNEKYYKGYNPDFGFKVFAHLYIDVLLYTAKSISLNKLFIVSLTIKGKSDVPSGKLKTSPLIII
mgnify:CR=1 FL=1